MAGRISVSESMWPGGMRRRAAALPASPSPIGWQPYPSQPFLMGRQWPGRWRPSRRLECGVAIRGTWLQVVAAPASFQTPRWRSVAEADQRRDSLSQPGVGGQPAGAHHAISNELSTDQRRHSLKRGSMHASSADRWRWTRASSRRHTHCGCDPITHGPTRASAQHAHPCPSSSRYAEPGAGRPAENPSRGYRHVLRVARAGDRPGYRRPGRSPGQRWSGRPSVTMSTVPVARPRSIDVRRRLTTRLIQAENHAERGERCLITGRALRVDAMREGG